ncbi:PROTEIN MALE DISCOVERER 2 [Salix viminalis]|uniref:PROTEIN MALE DISCOVERER 2 n=1 Tax=Salix viminalis TaxID=40686 RepID=A0A9Q0T7R4_SALVM|nr:PROTEIN MALE DISCOVERER 2 [Salix viminalis]
MEYMDFWAVRALTTFKEAIYEDPHMVLSNWNALDADPCGWSGISCSFARDHVVKINITGLSLRGFLAPELGRIKFLQQLVLHGNNLIGIIPKELGTLKYLQVLDLGANQLTGPIPPEIANLTSVIKINLQSNGGSDFTSSVYGIYASSTNLTGLCRASELKVADFSFNFFTGSIPKCLGYLPSTSFQGNCLQNKDPRQRASSICDRAPPARNHLTRSPKHQPAEDKSKQHQRGASKPAWLLALEIVTGTMKLSSQKDHVNVYIDSEMLKDVVRFSRQELEVACEDFSNIIGSSPDSLVYKGIMKGGPEIAVISLCIKEEHWTGYLELYFQREVADLARLNNENTGKLLGYCKESTPFTRMLVIEYASNGTLYEHLHYGDGCNLSWTRRMKIVKGIARGLKYLHTELEPPFTISELNSSSVYLTEEFSPKLVDFESWKSILARSEKNSGAIGSQGAICVLPHSLEGRHLDVQGNIYAFGVLLLEIISGRPPYCKDKGRLVDWAKDFLELPEAMAYVVDPELKHFRFEDLKVICEVVNFASIQTPPSSLPCMS